MARRTRARPAGSTSNLYRAEGVSALLEGEATAPSPRCRTGRKRNGPGGPVALWACLGLPADLAGLDAGGADVEALGRPGDERANGLDVRVPAAAGAAVRVRVVVAEARPLAAYGADGGHGSVQIIG